MVSPEHFVYDFSKKCFSCYIQLTKQIAMSLILETLGNMCIAIICFLIITSYEVIYFEINLTF